MGSLDSGKLVWCRVQFYHWDPQSPGVDHSLLCTKLEDWGMNQVMRRTRSMYGWSCLILRYHLDLSLFGAMLRGAMILTRRIPFVKHSFLKLTHGQATTMCLTSTTLILWESWKVAPMRILRLRLFATDFPHWWSWEVCYCKPCWGSNERSSQPGRVWQGRDQNRWVQRWDLQKGHVFLPRYPTP